MDTPFHPIIVHFPIALAFTLPILVLVFAFMIRTQKMAPQAWLIILGLQVFTTVSGYVALESGENEEHVVKKVVDKEIIHEHEETAEVFVGLTVITLVVSIASYFLRKEFQFYAQLSVVLVSLIACYFAYRAGEKGGEIVYRYKAPNAYALKDQAEGLLPTPGVNTSESSEPVNESLNPDENDYGKADESSELEDDEDSKVED